MNTPKEEIQESNRLIAEFMGGVYKKSDKTGELDSDRIYIGEDEAMYFVSDPNPDRKFIPHQYELKYHKSFDWIMPVVVRIEQGLFAVEIKENHCKIAGYRKYEGILFYHKNSLESKLESTYKSVVQFIRWYNTQSL